TIITWLVVQVSDRPADEEHHYGHGKLESISALGVIALLYVLAGGILVESYSRLREGAPPPTITAIPFIVLLVDIAVNFWRAKARRRERPRRSGPCPAWSMSNGCGYGWSGRRISSTPSCRCRAPIRSTASRRSSEGHRMRSPKRSAMPT